SIKDRFFILHIVILGLFLPLHGVAQTDLSLGNGHLYLQWEKQTTGYKLTHAEVVDGNQAIVLPNPLGEYTVIYAADKPDSIPVWSELDEKAKEFSETSYRLLTNRWKNSLKPVALNTAGVATDFFPASGQQKNNKVSFSHTT